MIDLFKGMERCTSSFTMPQASTYDSFGRQRFDFSSQGLANRLTLTADELLASLQQAQQKYGLKPTENLNKNSLHYTVEMETGTGKTYVYLRTIYELYATYGMTKFIIVVPSIAIKEGVKKTIEITREHFISLYKETRCDAFIYDSGNLEQVRNFAESSHIQIMVINIDAFRKSFTDPSQEETKANIIHRTHDRLEGLKPIDLIAQTHPVVIIVDTTPKSAEAIGSLHPLFTLRYSATHRDQHLPIYKLDAVDAYQKKLVKQIAVLSVLSQDDHNRAYIKLLDTRNSRGVCEAQVEYDSATKTGKVKRDKKWLKQGADLYELTKRDLYEGYIIKDINVQPGDEWIDFTSKPEIITLGQSIGSSDDLALKRLQIRSTIETHLDRELQLNPKGIKVLSLFFIDKVVNYRAYDPAGNLCLGSYGKIFEEEYLKISQHLKYQSLFKEIAINQIHDGYFAIDKKKKAKDTKGNTQDDESAYDLIMKDKERLLSMEEPLRFIFSHSALREGWDNPNVFQICTLNETGSTIKKRQEIGRGLRLAVDQSGLRVSDNNFNINTLTVIANESYESFAEQLQKEIEEEGSIKFGIIESHTFANLAISADGEEIDYLGTERSEQLWDHFKKKGLINAEGKIQDSLKIRLRDNTLCHELPEDLQKFAPEITTLLQKIAGGLEIKDARKYFTATPKKEVILGEDFTQLWDRIKYKTTYQVDFDLSKLIIDCATELQQRVISKPKLTTQLSEIEIKRSGVHGKGIREDLQTYDIQYENLPDILSYLQNETQLTRKTLVNILIKSEKLADFKKNPQKFTENILHIIQRKKAHGLVDGIKYEKIGESACYEQQLFMEEELKGYLEQNMLEVKKGIYSHVVYDSSVESAFAQDLEKNEAVKLYAKLPSWFKIDTSLGSYNPDWAIFLNIADQEKLYFVVETKGSLFAEDLRQSEIDKIKCGKAHFLALDKGLRFEKVSKLEELFEQT
ncbi:type III restriction-modification system endonuclease [Candidatus Nitrosacidococcus sp. I8]|uniref:type III restriction-modification system endonuclease n=1 Tax=Candidatus Nitrosacidococcus sp. I8 TaxID=2942908 RepID=UPI0022278872|nr:DEAD/DEAH box helicase family protein [Candidatus Nitrosacidococcus sp. I8]CAH9018284.1 hypothetical protein NURINAE_00836 [Candidatus Nitrosacidococcus sp. I8]